MCFSRTGLEKELLNESCYVLKHALIHKCRALQNGSRELQPTKSSSEFVLSVYTATFLQFPALKMCPNRCQQQLRSHREAGASSPTQLHKAEKQRMTTSTYSNNFYSQPMEAILHSKYSLSSFEYL